MTPREKMMIVVPLVAGLVIVLVYFGLFTNPLVILAIFILYVAISLRNKRKFNRQRSQVRALGGCTPKKLAESATDPALPVAVPRSVGLDYVFLELAFSLADESAVASQVLLASAG